MWLSNSHIDTAFESVVIDVSVTQLSPSLRGLVYIGDETAQILPSIYSVSIIRVDFKFPTVKFEAIISREEFLFRQAV